MLAGSAPIHSRPVARRAVLRAVAGATVLAAPHVARAAPRTLRCTHNENDDSGYAHAARAFAAAVAADPVLSGVIRLDVQSGGNLGDELSLLQDCRDGTLDLLISSGVVMGNVVPAAGLINAPFLFRDIARAHSVLDGPLGEEVAAIVRANKLYMLAWGENGLRHVTANRPVRSPEDFKGLRIRTPQSEIILNGFRALGAAAAPLSFQKLRDALHSGQFDAQENAIVVIESSKLYQDQKFLNLTGHVYDPAFFLASSDVVEDLTAPQLQALAACAAKAASVTREVAGAAQISGVGRLAARGVTVVTDVDTPALRAASRPFLDSLVQGENGDLMRRLIAAG